MSEITVQVYEGSMPPEFLLADLLLPSSLSTTTDRCDRCGAEAWHAFVFLNQEGGETVMLACNHHGREFHNSSAPYLAHKDYREPLEQWQKRNSDEQAEALKKINAGKLDDSNYSAGTSNAKHKAQWDLQYWSKR